MGLMDALVFSVSYNFKWQRLLYILGLSGFVYILHDGLKLPSPWWHIFGFYGISWIGVVLADTVLKRARKDWPA